MDLVVGDLCVPALWLRDACSCPSCRDAGSGQRLTGVTALDAETTLGDFVVDGDRVLVTFEPDGHAGVFSLAWLRDNAPGRAAPFDDRAAPARRTWAAADLGVGVRA